VFGYPNLYAVGGAVVPSPIGRNRSHMIAALAERIAGGADHSGGPVAPPRSTDQC
jgi:choline dehydrogenase-like flavoprotein